jgi:hypothetical protein
LPHPTIAFQAAFFDIFAPLQDGEAGNRMTQVKARYLRKN